MENSEKQKNRRPWWKNPAIMVPAIIAIIGIIVGPLASKYINPSTGEPDFALSIETPTGIGYAGHTTNPTLITVTVKAIHGWDSDVTLRTDVGQDGISARFQALPGWTGIQRTLQALTINPADATTAILEIQINEGVAVGTYEIKVIAEGGSKVYERTYTLEVAPKYPGTTPTVPSDIPTKILPRTILPTH